MKIKILSVVIFLFTIFVVGFFVGNSGAQPTIQTIYVVNNSSVPNWKLKDSLPAFQKALDEDLGPIWNVYATLQIYDNSFTLDDTNWIIELKDKSDEPMAAGYHSFIDAPYALVTAREGVNWQLVFSHELFEMLVDPYVDRASYLAKCSFISCSSDSFYAVEVADPVQNIKWSYRLPSNYGRPVIISDFVTPAWYATKGGKKMDFAGYANHHHKILKGGFQYVCKDGFWKPIFIFKKP